MDIFWMVCRESSHWIWSREQKYTRLRKIWKAGGTNCFCSNEWTPAISLPCTVLNWRMGQKYFCRSQSRSGGWKCLATVSPAVRSPRRWNTWENRIRNMMVNTLTAGIPMHGSRRGNLGQNFTTPHRVESHF